MKKAKTEIKIEPYPKGGWYVVERAINNGYLRIPTCKTLLKGCWVRLFKYDDIKDYFEHLRGL